jgi:hypothetical protein
VATIAAVTVGIVVSAVAPAALTGHIDSTTRYESLREQVRRDGPNDVVVIGDSMIHGGVIPRVVSAGLRLPAADARAPRVFNFGIAGHGVLTYPLLVELVLRADRPKIFVFRIAPRGVDATAAENNRWADVVGDSSYADALLDPFRLRGSIAAWLLDHWALRNRGPALRALALGLPRDAKRLRGEYDPDRGYRPRPDRVVNAKMRAHHRAIVQVWSTSPRYDAALDVAVQRVVGTGADVLLVDAPLRGALRELMRDPDRNVEGTRQFMVRAAERLHVRAAFTPPGLVADKDFADLTHLGPRGADRYSRWLAVEIAAVLAKTR